jgi:hypothetical protein
LKTLRKPILFGKTKANAYDNDYIIELIELATQAVYTYEQYLLDKADRKTLAKKMKSLQLHIENHMGGKSGGKKSNGNET